MPSYPQEKKSIPPEVQWYAAFCAALCVLTVTGNLVHQKILALKVFFIPTAFVVSAGVLWYPWIYLLTNLSTHRFGANATKSFLHIALGLDFVFAALLAVVDALPSASWSRIDDPTFHLVFGSYWKAIISSLVAQYVTQRLEIWLYHHVFIYFYPAKLRIFLNTSLALFLDSVLVVGLMTLQGAFLSPNWRLQAIQTFGVKIFVLILAYIFMYPFIDKE